MTPEQAYELLGDGVMWYDGEGYFMLRSDTQDTVRIPTQIAQNIAPRLTHYTRFEQDRWYRADKKWDALAEQYQSVGSL